MPIYDLGDGVPLELKVRNTDDVLTDATVSIAITRPDGTTFTPPSITHFATGVYRATPIPDQVGVNWAGVWSTSGAVVSVTPFAFSVADPAPMAYADLTLVKSMLGKSTDDIRDDLIIQAIAAASRMIDRRCGRYFYADRTASTRTFPVSNRRYFVDLDQVVLVDDISTSTGVTVSVGTTSGYTSVATFELGPFNTTVRAAPYTEIRAPAGWAVDFQRIQVTAKWGWPAVPDEIASATALLASRLYRRKDSPAGILSSPEFGGTRIARTDPDIEALIAPYVNYAIA